MKQSHCRPPSLCASLEEAAVLKVGSRSSTLTAGAPSVTMVFPTLTLEWPAGNYLATITLGQHCQGLLLVRAAEQSGWTTSHAPATKQVIKRPEGFGITHSLPIFFFLFQLCHSVALTAGDRTIVDTAKTWGSAAGYKQQMAHLQWKAHYDWSVDQLRSKAA